MTIKPHAKPAKVPIKESTVNGYPLAPRRARFWQWLKARGILLHSFSTDTCVLAYMPKLEAAHLDALRYLLSDDPELPTESELADLLTDLEALMRRTPANRVRPDRS